MNREQFDQAIEFFKRHTGCNPRQAFKLASYADCIIRSNDNKDVVETVLYGIRNAYMDGVGGYY